MDTKENPELTIKEVFDMLQSLQKSVEEDMQYLFSKTSFLNEELFNLTRHVSEPKQTLSDIVTRFPNSDDREILLWTKFSGEFLSHDVLSLEEHDGAIGEVQHNINNDDAPIETIPQTSQNESTISTAESDQLSFSHAFVDPKYKDHENLTSHDFVWDDSTMKSFEKRPFEIETVQEYDFKLFWKVSKNEEFEKSDVDHIGSGWTSDSTISKDVDLGINESCWEGEKDISKSPRNTYMDFNVSSFSRDDNLYKEKKDDDETPKTKGFFSIIRRTRGRMAKRGISDTKSTKKSVWKTMKDFFFRKS